MIISHKYEVQDQLGQGSMGVVYKVRHMALETTLALKVLPTHLMGNPELVKRFYREARVMARLNHPNIVRVIDIQRDDERQFYYFVMEYIQGQTLWQYLQERGALPLREVIELTRQVACALDYAHSHNPPVIHRDIKPTNIMIEDRSRRVVVMDFGIAKELDESELTRAGTMLGTLKYCPPEQMRHEPLDGSADVYALGMVMYEAYTGMHLLADLGEEDVIRKVLDPQEHELALTRGTPAEFVGVVARAVAKTREKRYRRMAELLSDLDTRGSVLDETTPSHLPLSTRAESPLPGEHEALTAQVHKLEEKRRRRLVLQLQAQVQESKEKAAREGAGWWASTLFQQGCAREESGHEHLRERHYEQAREAYQEAADLLAQACEEAIAQALVQRTRQARQEMGAAKLEADQYGALERAPTFYQRGLKLQAQAEELWESQSYREAWQIYGEARGVFEDAHELAYRALLQEEVKAAQEQLKAARELAVKDQAEEFASEAFGEAVRSEGRGDTALGQEEFTQARELYRAAVQQYERAQQQARGERQRRAAVGAQQQAQAACAEAEAVGAGPEQEAYRQAQEAQGRGEARLQGQAYEQAVQEYGRAREAYARAGQEAERARRRQAAVAARARVEEVRAAAEQAGVRGRFAEALAAAEQKVEQGRKSEEGEEFTAALGLYEEAAQALSGLREAAEREAVREEAEAARGRLSETRKKGVALRGWAEAAWVQAEVEATQAETAWQGQAYRGAVELYGRAVQAYARAEREAEEERGRQQAIEARRQTEEAQKAAQAAEAQRYNTQKLYRQAEEAMRQGEQRLKADRWAEATNEFVKARGLFDESLEVAKQAKAKQAAEAARDSALVEQRKAQEGGASELFPDGFAEAVALLHQAEQKLTQEDYNTAQAIFERSTALFQQVYDEAVVHLQREQAEGARARAHEFQDRLSSVKKGRQQRRAHKTLVQGDRLFQQGSYTEARVKYEEAISLFSALLETSLAAPAGRKIALVSHPFVLYPVLILGLLSIVIVLYLALYPSTLPEIAEGKKTLEQGDLGRFKRADADTKRLDKEREQAEREASIAKLLNEARKALAGDRLMTPAGENAVELAAQVLVLEPGHQGAQQVQQVLAEVVTRYVGLGEAALSKKQLDKAQVYHKTAQGLVQRYQLPDSEVGRLAERIAAQEQRMAEEVRREAEAKRLAEEQQRRAEAERLAEEQRRKEEEKRLAEEQRRKVRAAQIEALLSKARQALAANRLTTPVGDNAIEYAEQLLALAPKQGGARQVLIEVVGRYVAQGEVALSQVNLAGAQGYCDIARQVAKKYRLPETELRSLSERIASTQQRLEDQARLQAEQAKKAREQARRKEEAKRPAKPAQPQREQQEASEFARPTEEQRQLQKERERLQAEKARLEEQLRQPPPSAPKQDVFLLPSF
jgi:serine/threonine protein kinase